MINDRTYNRRSAEDSSFTFAVNVHSKREEITSVYTADLLISYFDLSYTAINKLDKEILGICY